MATISTTPTATSLAISDTTSKSGTISWTCPTLPVGSTITSCVLTGTPTFSMNRGKATVTVNGTSVSDGVQFTINLGTSNTTKSVNTTGRGNNRNSSGTITFTSLSYTVTYEEPVTKTENIMVGTSTVQTIYLGTTEIVRVYIGDTLVYGE